MYAIQTNSQMLEQNVQTAVNVRNDVSHSCRPRIEFVRIASSHFLISQCCLVLPNNGKEVRFCTVAH